MEVWHWEIVFLGEVSILFGTIWRVQVGVYARLHLAGCYKRGRHEIKAEKLHAEVVTEFLMQSTIEDAW